MFEGIVKIFKKLMKQEEEEQNSKNTAKERLHLVLMQDRANVSADFLELMKQEIIEVIKKYIEVDEGAIDVRLTNKNGEEGENGAPALYANIPILNIRNDMKKVDPQTGKAQESVKKEIESKSEKANTKANESTQTQSETTEKNENTAEQNDKSKDVNEPVSEINDKTEVKETSQN